MPSQRTLTLFSLALAGFFALGAQAQTPPPLDAAEKAAIAALSLSALPPLSPDLTNSAVSDTTAMALGATLFFDTRMSRNGQVACSTCHKIGEQFQDGLPVGKAIGTMTRRTQPLAGVAWQQRFFWDGRKDSLWSQALAPLEKDVEHGLTRAWIVHFIAANFRDRYERVFGLMPDLSDIPADAGPLGTPEQISAWDALSDQQRDDTNRIFANTGKMIAAFEQSLEHKETRFDHYAKALADGAVFDADHSLSAQEIEGLRLFIGKAGCAACHSGPRFTDGAFHNTGAPVGEDLAVDLGRVDGAVLAASDEFGCSSRYSDAPMACETHEPEAATLGAFKTPSLRGVATRAPYMHAGQFASLEDVLAHYRAAPAAPTGESEIKPLAITDAEALALIAFLKALD